MNRPDKLSLQPKTFVLKHVRADLKTLFLSLGEAAVQAKIGEAGEALSSFYKAKEAVRIKRPPEELAWQLVCDGLARAMIELLRFDNDQALPAVIYDGDLDHLKNRTEILVKDADVAITRDFFKNPSALPILGAVEQTLAGWLRFLRPNQPDAKPLNESQARSLAARLHGYFPYALHEEWRAHRHLYQPLLERFETPFAEAVQMEWNWERNRVALIKQMDEPVFEETFSIRQVYVPLRAYHEEHQEGRSRHDGEVERNPRRVLHDLETAVVEWLDGRDGGSDALCLVAGGPGSGKSTFAKHLAAKLSAEHKRVLFFELQDFDMEEKIESAIGTYFRRREAFDENPVEHKGFASPARPLLLIFDGLDELGKPSDYADIETSNFIFRLNSAVNGWNKHGRRRVLALITGRTPAVQSHTAGLDLGDRQRLWVLPYAIRKEARNGLNGPQEQLDRDQRREWWARYAETKGLDPSRPPESLLGKELSDLTAEPLLCYLIVLSGFLPKRTSEENANPNRVYEELYRGVIERRHAGGAKLPAAKAIDDETFDRLMETIAVAAWWGGEGRIASVEQIRHACGDDRYLREALHPFVEAGHRPARLFAAFYFREADGRRHSGNAFEFTHKRFSEYLTARRLVREIDDIHRGLTHVRHYEDKALHDWGRLCGPTSMTVEILEFLRNEVSLRAERDPTRVAAWQKTMMKLFDRELLEGFPLQALGGTAGFREAAKCALNAEESLLGALNTCAGATGARSAIQWPSITAAGDLIHRLRGQRDLLRKRTVALEALSLLDLRKQRCSWQELSGADLSCSDLGEIELYRADLSGADLSGADLSDAELSWADLSEANLSRARFTGADLSGADLSRARFSGADLSGADLSGANLSRADLSDAVLSGANLSDAVLSGANLSGTTLSGARFSGADLSGVWVEQPYLWPPNLPPMYCATDLSGAMSVTREQIDSAQDIRGAKLPDHLRDLEVPADRCAKLDA